MFGKDYWSQLPVRLIGLYNLKRNRLFDVVNLKKPRWRGDYCSRIWRNRETRAYCHVLSCCHPSSLLQPHRYVSFSVAHNHHSGFSLEPSIPTSQSLGWRCSLSTILSIRVCLMFGISFSFVILLFFYLQLDSLNSGWWLPLTVCWFQRLW